MHSFISYFTHEHWGHSHR